MVLIIVLIVVTMISLAGFSFVATMNNEDKATRLRGTEIQAQCLIESGDEYIRWFLEQPPEFQHQNGGIDHNPDLLQGLLIFNDRVEKLQGRVTVIAPRWEEERVAGFRFGLVNESSKLNLNVLLQWEKRKEGTGRDALLAIPGMSESVADAILDWMDPDDQPRALGAEEEYYRTLPAPYHPRNGPLESIEELLLVRGVTRRDLYGWDGNRNYVIDPEERARAERSRDSGLTSEPDEQIPWIHLLTVRSGERNMTPEGKPKVFLNDRDVAKLHRDLARQVGRPMADFVIAYRQFGPYRGSASPTSRAAPSPDLAKPVRGKIRSPLELVDAKVRISQPGEKPLVIVASPLSQRSGALGRDLLEFLDRVTIDPRPVIPGRIDINQAPLPVLKAIPGMDPSVAQQIVTSRQSPRRDSEDQHRHAAWLFLERVVELDEFQELAPYLTGSGGIYSGQLVGFFSDKGPVARGELVWDATQRPVRRVYWKDLRVLGRGFSHQVLGGDKRVPLDGIGPPSSLAGFP